METSNGSGPQAESPKRRIRDRLWGARRVLKDVFYVPPPPDPAAEAARIEGIKAEIRQGDKDWAKKDVDIESINIKDLPINWNALTDLGHSINDLKNSPYTDRDLSEITPPKEAFVVLPHLASIIAHHRNPEIPVTLPTESEIKDLKPWLTIASGLIGKMSENWGKSFNRYIEKRGGKVIEDIGKKIYEFADAVATIDNPKEQFLDEITRLYRDVSQPEYVEDDSLFGLFFGGDREVSVEDKIAKLIRGLTFVREEGNHDIYSKKDYPLLNIMLPVVKFPPYSLNPQTAGIAGAEFMEGLAIFLHRSGVRNLPPPPGPKPFDFFDFGSWQRSLAEVFVPERLERVKMVLPDVLGEAQKTLPTNGLQFADEIYEMAEGICILKEQGYYSYDLAKRMFR